MIGREFHDIHGGWHYIEARNYADCKRQMDEINEECLRNKKPLGFFSLFRQINRIWNPQK
jgi:hypothetical protein